MFHGNFLIFVHKNMNINELQKIKIRPWEDFELRPFFLLFFMRKRLSSGQKWFLRSAKRGMRVDKKKRIIPSIAMSNNKKQYLSTLAGWPWLQTFTNWWFISAPKSGREPNPFIVQCGESAENASVCLWIPTKSLSLHLNKKGIECHHCGCNKSPKTSCWKDSKNGGRTNGDYDSNPTFWQSKIRHFLPL